MANYVITPSNSRTSQLYDVDANATLLLTEGASIIEARTGYPAYYATGGGVRATIKGTAIAYGGVASLFIGSPEASTGNGNNHVTVSASGDVEGNSGVALFGGGNTLVNAGMIRGTGTADAGGIPNNVAAGVYMKGGGSIENSGTISGHYGVYVGYAGDISIRNSGTISTTAGDRGDAINTFQGTLSVNNSGLISGDISCYDATRCDITNTGTIDGDIYVVNANIQNYGTITGRCGGNSGDDFVVNYGRISYVSVIDGTDYVYNKAGGIIDSIEFGLADGDLTGKDYCTNDGQVDRVSFSTSDDTFENTGSVASSVSMNDGNNSVTNSGSIAGQLSSGDGADTILNYGTVGSLYTGGGADKVFLGAESVLSQTAVLGYGEVIDDDTLTNQGVLGVDLDTYLTGAASLYFGDGSDRLDNTGMIYGAVDMGAGNFADIVNNHGTIRGVIVLGAGNDTVDTSGGVITGKVDLGAGSDSYVGGAAIDRVIGGASADSVDLASGDDTYLAINNDSNDVVDGGDGIDTYNAGAATLAIRVDLDAGVTSGTIGLDVITRFENIVGGRQNDVLIGNDSTNCIEGGAGGDVIIGGAGDDRLIGGGGADTITGGTGRDVMTGGLDADSFVFTAGSTGLGGSSRDVVTDFTDHGPGAPPANADLIYLSAIDANTKVSGDQAFTFNPVEGAAFSGAGSLVWRQSGGFALVLGDVNGDGTADFSIQLSGTHTMTAADFVL